MSEGSTSFNAEPVVSMKKTITNTLFTSPNSMLLKKESISFNKQGERIMKNPKAIPLCDNCITKTRETGNTPSLYDNLNESLNVKEGDLANSLVIFSKFDRKKRKCHIKINFI